MAAFLGVQYKGILGSGFALGQKGIRMPSGGALLLDQYSGAAAAYSVRKLSSSYSGSALRVRRSSDNAEQDIGFSGNDLDTSALTTFVGANDGFVVTWYDQSGNAFNAINTTASQQPKIIASGSLVVDGAKAAIDFNGSTEYLYNASSIPYNGGVSWYTVVNLTTGPNERIWSDDIIGAQGFTQFFALGNSVVNDNGTGFKNVTTPTLTTSVKSLVNLNLNDSTGNYNYSLNGSSTAASIASWTGPIDSPNASNVGIMSSGNGAGQFAEGKMQELIIYPNDQSTNRAAIESNINTYYNIYWDGSQTSLLDDYPSSSAAYSVRALNSAYTGPLLRVRRSSDNAEQDIRALYDGNLDEEGLLNFVGANDGFVVTWYDQSGNGLDITNATAAQQPQIVSSGTLLTIGSKPTVRFDGTDDRLTRASMLLSKNTMNVVSVQKFVSIVDTTQMSLAITEGTGGRQTYIPYRTSSGFEFWLDNSNAAPTAITADTNQHLWGVFNNGVTGQRYDNGVPFLASFANVNLTSLANFHMGSFTTGALNANVEHQELVIWNTDQTGNRADIESNINTYYSIY